MEIVQDIQVNEPPRIRMENEDSPQQTTKNNQNGDSISDKADFETMAGVNSKKFICREQVTNVLKVLFNDESGKDLTIMTSDKSFKCHSAIFRLVSQFTAKILLSLEAESEVGEDRCIIIPDTPGGVVEAFLKRMYFIKADSAEVVTSMTHSSGMKCLLDALQVKVITKVDKGSVFNKQETDGGVQLTPLAGGTYPDTVTTWPAPQKESSSTVKYQPNDVRSYINDPELEILVCNGCLKQMVTTCFLKNSMDRKSQAKFRCPSCSNDKEGPAEKDGKDTPEIDFNNHETDKETENSLSSWSQKIIMNAEIDPIGTEEVKVKKEKENSPKSFQIRENKMMNHFVSTEDDTSSLKPKPPKVAFQKARSNKRKRDDLQEKIPLRKEVEVPHVKRDLPSGLTKPGPKKVVIFTSENNVKKKVLPCTICGKDVGVPMTSYIKLTQSGLSSSSIFRCSNCSKQEMAKKHVKPQVSVKEESPPSVQPAIPETIVPKDAICTICDKKFQNNLQLEYHMNLHNNHNPFMCDRCDFKTHSAPSLNLHFAQKHVTEEKKIKEICPLCKEVKTPKHWESHHDPSLQNFSCKEEGCEFRADSEIGISNHGKRIHGKKLDKVQCPHCVCMILPDFFKKHLFDSHTENLPHQCEHCGFKSLTDMGIKTHVGRYHSEAKKKYPCKNGCGRYFQHNFMATKHAKHHCDLNPEGKAISQEITRANNKRGNKTKKENTRKRLNLTSEK